MEEFLFLEFFGGGIVLYDCWLFDNGRSLLFCKNVI